MQFLVPFLGLSSKQRNIDVTGYVIIIHKKNKVHVPHIIFNINIDNRRKAPGSCRPQFVAVDSADTTFHLPTC